MNTSEDRFGVAESAALSDIELPTSMGQLYEQYIARSCATTGNYEERQKAVLAGDQLRRARKARLACAIDGLGIVHAACHQRLAHLDRDPDADYDLLFERGVSKGVVQLIIDGLADIRKAEDHARRCAFEARPEAQRRLKRWCASFTNKPVHTCLESWLEEQLSDVSPASLDAVGLEDQPDGNLACPAQAIAQAFLEEARDTIAQCERSRDAAAHHAARLARLDLCMCGLGIVIRAAEQLWQELDNSSDVPPSALEEDAVRYASTWVQDCYECYMKACTALYPLVGDDGSSHLLREAQTHLLVTQMGEDDSLLDGVALSHILSDRLGKAKICLLVTGIPILINDPNLSQVQELLCQLLDQHYM